MIKTTTSVITLAITALLSAPIQAGNSVGYWYDSKNELVRTGYGECWRTSRWSKNNAIAECEGGMAKKANDSDNDGVIDSKDRCDGTPRGVSVDSNGCTLDSDKDGVADNLDKCKATPKGVKVNATGCAIDTDKDGVPDSMDQCKNTIKGAKVDSKGCAIDSDNDGIADINDDCKGTPAGTVVNTRGCKLTANISLDNVQFKTGTSVLSSESKSLLDSVASVLLKNKHLKFEIAGHTDNTGNYNNNVNLSAARASSVKQYLVNKGVSSNALTTRGYGPDKPVSSNDTWSGRKMNRRVELVLQK